METLQTNQATTPLFPSQTSQVVETPDAKPALSSDFETFLKMLTVQMQNQDPLNPIDSGDYAVQLATFSSVEQQVLTNDLLKSVGDQLSGGGVNQLSQWVGMEVQGGNSTMFDGYAVDMHVPEAQDADRRILVIQQEDGSVLTRLDIAAKGESYSWEGQMTGGSIAPVGNYKFRVESYLNGENIASEEAVVYNIVEEARLGAGFADLVLGNGTTLNSNDVIAVRKPPT